MTRFSLSTVFALLFALVSCPVFAQATQVQDISVQLFYETSGTFSEDVTKTKDFHYWNTLIGEGDAKEPANSFLVTIFLRGKPESFDAKEFVTITITDENPKKFKPGVRPEQGDFGDDWVNWSPYTYRLTGQPAASVPCGRAANGLPGDRAGTADARGWENLNICR